MRPPYLSHASLFCPAGLIAVLALLAPTPTFAQTLFTDAAYVYPGIEPCPDDYTQVANCYNEEAPPPPSIRRSLVTPMESYSLSNALSAWEVPLDCEINPQTPGDRLVLPFRRAASNDARLVVRGRKPPDDHAYAQVTSGYVPAIMLFRGESVAHDLKVGAQPAMDEVAVGYLHPVMVHNPWDSNMASKYDLDAAILDGPGTFHMDLCEDASAEPRYCTAPLSNAGGSGEWVEGDCYDETVLVSLEQGDLKKAELRSVPLTIFLPDAKSSTNSDIYIYPRTTGSTLPAISLVESLDQVGVDQSWNDVLSACEDDGAGLPFYCQYVASQSFLENFLVHKKKDWETDPYVVQAGGVNSSYYFTFLEPMTTSDGRLLVLNGGSSLYYSFNEDRCEAAGFTRFEPVSKMPVDPDIYNNYDIGRSQRQGGQPIPFRTSLNTPIEPGKRIDGAYPWIDRQGKNLVFSHQNAARDHYKASSFHPSHSSQTDPFDMPGNRNRTNPDQEPGKQVSVLGAWTQGKTVVLDNVSNYSDFGGVGPYRYVGSPHLFTKSFKLDLYQGESTLVRPLAPRGLSSLENQFNHVNSISPLSPFDVVWNVSTNTKRNSEVIFDEYLLNSALIVAHMNAPVGDFPDIGGQDFRALPIDGFFPEVPTANVRGGGNARFGYLHSPYVQNAATTSTDFRTNADSIPSHLYLMGGARIEPVAMGGARGKGIYLDGRNDYLETADTFDLVDPGDWYLGVWLDSREASASRVRTVFYLPDGSSIAMSREVIRTRKNAAPNGPYKDLRIADLGLEESTFYHFGVKVRTTLGKSGLERRLEFLINGTRVENKVLEVGNVEYPGRDSISYPLQEGTTFRIGGVATPRFVLGHPGPGGRRQAEEPDPGTDEPSPFKGWVDELRVYRLDEQAAEPQSHFDEFACNLALGTLVRVRENDTHPLLEPLVATAWRHGLYHGTPPPGIIGGRAREFLIFEDDFETGNLDRWLATDEAQRALVCEQMVIGSFDSLNEYPDQHDQTLCAGRVHKNAIADDALALRCMREHIYEIADKPLEAGQPRPDFSTLPFCQSCHDEEATIAGLDEPALEEGTLARQNDPRRQPLDHRQKITGCIPDVAPFSAGDDRCAPGQLWMDWVFDYSRKVEND